MRIAPSLAVLGLALLFCPAAALAQSPPPAVTVHMAYTGKALGLTVMRLDADLISDRDTYRVDLNYHTVGLLALFVRNEQHSTAWGLWHGEAAEPQRFWGWGHLRGQPRETLIDYQNGIPVIERLTPPAEDDRDQVPADERDATIDALSALAFLVHRAADSETCDGSARLFDGRRLMEIDAHTTGEEALASRAWHGEALRCDFTGRQLAGFQHEASAAEWQRQSHGGAAWLAPVVAGAPPIPVRLVFGTRWVGDITMTLIAAGPGPLAQ